MVELGAIYRLCVSVCPTLLKKLLSPSDYKITEWMSSVCTALLKKLVSPSHCKITKWISLAKDLFGWINLKPPLLSLKHDVIED